jgi:hypothetical protein
MPLKAPPAPLPPPVFSWTGFYVGADMLIGTVVGAVSVIVALLPSPETKGKVFVSE